MKKKRKKKEGRKAALLEKRKNSRSEPSQGGFLTAHSSLGSVHPCLCELWWGGGSRRVPDKGPARIFPPCLAAFFTQVRANLMRDSAGAEACAKTAEQAGEPRFKGARCTTCC